MHLALIFPGRGYLHDHPVLRAVRLALAQVGASEVLVTYDDVDDSARFSAGVRRDVEAALAEHASDRVTLVAKSLGTHALAELARRDLVRDASAIWLTPVWHQDATWEAARASTWRSLHVVGLDDPWHDAERHAQVPGETLEVPGDHAFEVDGDALASVDTWRRITGAVLDFVR